MDNNKEPQKQRHSSCTQYLKLKGTNGDPSALSQRIGSLSDNSNVVDGVELADADTVTVDAEEEDESSDEDCTCDDTEPDDIDEEDLFRYVCAAGVKLRLKLVSNTQF